MEHQNGQLKLNVAQVWALDVEAALAQLGWTGGATSTSDPGPGWQCLSMTQICWDKVEPHFL